MIQDFNPINLKSLYIPVHNSVKGDNGKLMIIAGSVLFHAASLWPLQIASRIVDMVYFSSVKSNNLIVQKDKETFLNGIVIERKNLEKYIVEADSVLIGPGLPRDTGQEVEDESTKELTQSLIKKFPNKKWVIDGGSLQTINPEVLPQTSIITPNRKEFKMLFNLEPNLENAESMAKKFGITILLKGEEDIICSIDSASGLIRTVRISGGNQGMTKGGTGDVLAGLTASFYCKNEAYLSACAASFINKKASDYLYKKVGLYYNATDLVNEIPVVMKEFIL